jgi:hypothetical protein
MMHGGARTPPKSWLAFDLNVLRRLKFSSAALPFTHQPQIGVYLARWDIDVSANDPLLSNWAVATSHIANRGEKLTEDDVNVVLEDAYVPGYRLRNPALATWFSETDAWWFDNVRANIDRLQSPMQRAIAAAIAFAAGDYVLSFTDETRELRQPLSNVYRRLWSAWPDVSLTRSGSCVNKNPSDFIAESRVDLMFLRLPTAHGQSVRSHLGRTAWREEWLRGGNDFWHSFEMSLSGRLGSATETKSQYLHILEETLQRAAHIRSWAIAHVEAGFIQTHDLVETIGRIRRVEAVYTKDFSELTGTKAVIITA